MYQFFAILKVSWS